MTTISRHKAQIVHAYGRSSDMFVYHDNDMSSKGRTLKIDPKEHRSFKDRSWIEYSVRAGRDRYDCLRDFATDIQPIEDPTPKSPERIKPRISLATDKAALLADLAEYGVVNINPHTKAFGIGFEMVKAGELIITEHGSDYYGLSFCEPVTPLTDDQSRVLSECFALGLVEVVGEQMEDEEEAQYTIYRQLQCMGLIYAELNSSAMGVLYAKYEITETGKAIHTQSLTPLPFDDIPENAWVRSADDVYARHEGDD